MESPIIQKQHKIPEVYLKFFAIDKTYAQKKICVLMKGDTFTRKKNVKSFYRHENFFDINSFNPLIKRAPEELNGLLETHYPKIILELEKNRTLSEESTAYLIQLAANLISRSDVWRETVLLILKSNGKSLFIKHVIEHILTEEELENMDSNELFVGLNELTPDDCINRIMVFFYDHLVEYLWNFEITYFEAHDDKGWFTSDNPVVVVNELQNNFSPNSILYFPLTPKYLAFIHYRNSADEINLFRKYESNKIHKVNDEEMEFLTKTIIQNMGNCLICPYEIDWRIDANEKARTM